MSSELDDLLSSDEWTKPSEAPTAPAAQSPLDEVLGHKGWGETEQAKAAAPPSPVTEDTPWSEVLTRGAKNLPGDIPVTIGEIASGLGHAIMNPKETVKGIGSLAKGTYDYARGNETPDAEMAKAVGNELYNAYGTEKGWKEAIANRPFSRALDVGAVMTAPELAAGRLGAEGLAKGIRYANPATWMVGGTQKVLSGVGKLTSHGIGHMMTHTGGEPLIAAYQSARKGPEFARATKEGMYNDDLIGAVDTLKGSVDKFRNREFEGYRTDERALREDKQRLDLDPIFSALYKERPNFSSSDPFKAHPGWNKVKEVIEDHANKAAAYDEALLKEGGLYSPSGPSVGEIGSNPYLTPHALDQLKKDLSDLAYKNNGEPTGALAKRMSSVIGDYIRHESPIYGGMMDRYANLSDSLEGFYKELGLGGNKDTALRKLLSSFRNNVLANFGRRRALMKQVAALDPEAQKAYYKLAGASLSSWWPRGLIGQLKMGLAPFAGPEIAMHFGVNPLVAAPIIAAQSPKLMGHMALQAGKIGRKMSKVPWRAISPFLTAPGHQTPYTAMDLSPFLLPIQNQQGSE